MTYIIIILIALSISWFALRGVIYVYNRFNWLDKPGARKNHVKPVPAAGGVAIFLAVLITGLVLSDVGSTIFTNASLFIATSILVVVGAIDDRFNLSSVLRLLLQIGCSTLVAVFFVRVESLYGLFGIFELSQWVSYVLTVFILVGVINAYNMMDGIDGLAGSFSLVIALGLIALGLWLDVSTWNIFLLTMICALLMFLKFNWKPASIFMGDSGSMPLGFMFAAIGLYLLQRAGNSHAQSIVLVTITGAFIVPVIDTLRLFKYRMSRGRSPFSADRNHLHHWLLRNKMAHSQATVRIVFLQICTLGIGLLAIQFLDATSVVLIQAITVVLFIYISKRIASFFKWYGVIRRMEMSSNNEK